MTLVELELVLVDAAGHERGRFRVAYAAELRVGQELWLDLAGRRALVRVLRQRSDGGDRLVHAIEVSLACPFCGAPLLVVEGVDALERDGDGDFVACRHCGRRVAMERIPTTPPGGPTRLRVSADQGGWQAWE